LEDIAKADKEKSGSYTDEYCWLHLPRAGRTNEASLKGNKLWESKLRLIEEEKEKEKI
jgi:hypothetical protein